MAHITAIALVVAADEPALFYSSVRQAELDLEAIDVRNGVYPIAYDTDGRVFRLEAIGDRVRIRPVDELSPRPDELRTLILRYLSATGVRDIAAGEPLDSLLNRCIASAE